MILYLDGVLSIRGLRGNLEDVVEGLHNLNELVNPWDDIMALPRW